jgi:Gpi18-like mannosyltransferase
LIVPSKLRRKLVVAMTLAASLWAHLFLTQMPDTMGDVGMYAAWAASIESFGIEGAYFPAFAQRFPIDYPPVFPYLLGFLSWLRGLVDASPLGPASALEFWIPLPAALADLATAFLVYVSVKRIASWRAAYLSMLLYAFNPAVLFATAYWGVMDALNIFFALLALVFLDQRKPELAWLAITLGVFTKPFAAVIALLIAAITLGRYGWARTLRCGIVSLGVSALVLAPLLFTHPPVEAIHRVLFDFGNMPFVTSNAHNLWWSLTGGVPWVSVYSPAIGTLSYQTVGMLVFFPFWALVCAASFMNRDRVALYLLAALACFGFFMLSTHMHENHLFTALPLLAIVAVTSRPLAFVYAGASLTLLSNMLLHDPYLVTEFLYDLRYDPRHLMRFTFAPGGNISATHLWWTHANALLNLALFGGLAFLTLRRWRAQPSHKAALST